jgi:MFS family permease
VTARLNLEPFASTGYRRYFLAATLAAVGIWVYQPSIEWIVLTETGQAGAVGLLQTALIVAVAIATLPSGVLTDRFGARRTLAVSLLGIGVSIAVVAAVAAADRLTFGTALVLTFGLGIFDGLYGVPVVLLLPQVVEPRYLGAAIGLSFLTSGIGRLIGGPLGGTVLQVAGPVLAFVPAAICLAVSALVIATTPLLRGSEQRVRGGRGNLGNAVRYLPRERVVLAVTALATLSALSIFAYSALLPAYTRDNLGGESATLGLLSGAGGVGTILGALAMEGLGKRLGRGRVLVLTFLAAGLAVGALGLSQLLPVGVVLAAAITFFAIIFGGTAQLLVQTLPPPGLRAGVVALYTFVYYCVLPVGTAAVGALADRVGVTAVMLGMTALTIVGAVIVVLLEPRLLGVNPDLHVEPAREAGGATPVAPGA